jgi:prevent-host-death family protein
MVMRTIELNEAQAHLAELIDTAAGEEIIITRDQKPIARLTPSSNAPSLRDIRPASVGAVLKPLSSDDDLLDEMLT